MKIMLTPDGSMVIRVGYSGGGAGGLILTESGTDTCNCCPELIPCKPITEWRIKEASNLVDELSGVVSMGPAYQEMMNFPDPWYPRHYNAALPLTLSMKLQVKCEGEWKDLRAWSETLDTCDRPCRFPTEVFPAMAPPEPCDCIRNEEDPPMCVAACPEIYLGTQYEPPNDVAKTFTNAVDKEWTNLKNWADAAGASPASDWPNSESSIVIGGIVNTIPTYGGCVGEVLGEMQVAAIVDSVVVNAGAEIRIILRTRHAEVSGHISAGNEESCEGQYGQLWMEDPEIWATFEGSGEVEYGAKVVGRVQFNSSSRLRGWVTSDVDLRNSSQMANNAVDHARCGGDVHAYETAFIADADIQPAGNLTMYNQSHMDGTNSVKGGVRFHDQSGIDGGRLIDFIAPAFFDGSSFNRGTVEGDAEFSGSAINYGHVTGVATFTENARNKGTCEVDATFSGGAINDIDGIVEGDGTFDGGYNWGMVEGDAAFSGGGGNGTGGPGSGSPITGTVKGDATFEGSINTGIVEGDATFSAGGANYPNGTVEGNATFNASENKGTVEGTATFNVTGLNEGHVTGLATFNGATRNGGFADGDAIFNGTAENMTAGRVTGTATFNVDSNNYGINGTTVCNTTGNCP